MAPQASSDIETLPVISELDTASLEEQGAVGKSRLQVFLDICTPWCWAPVTLAQKITRALIWIVAAGAVTWAFVVLFPR